MSPQQKYLIRKSFAQLAGLGHIPALIFYRRLFELAPALRHLFKSDIEEQASKLLDMLASLISHLEQSDLLFTELRLMGQRHAVYGVKSEHYEIVGSALIGMLSETLREDFTAETQEAWKLLYRDVAEQMQSGAAVTTESQTGTE